MTESAGAAVLVVDDDDGYGGAGGHLDATARLARDAAHDLNNELLAIRGYGSMLRTTLLAAEQVAVVDEILNAAARAAGVTSRLAGLGGHAPRTTWAIDRTVNGR